MIPFVGFFALVPGAIAFASIVVTTAVTSAVWGALARTTGSSAVATAGTLCFVAVSVMGVELVLRARRAKSGPRELVRLESLSVSTSIGMGTVGGNAFNLGRAARAGVPVPETLVVTSALAKQWLESNRAGKHSVAMLDTMPAHVRRDLDRFLFGLGGARVVVRPSFSDEDPEITYPGTFATVRDVDSRKAFAVIEAVLEVLRSFESEEAIEYRRRRRATTPLPRAVILQRQVDADVTARVLSRGLDGRADTAIVDWSRKTAAIATARVDLLAAAAHSLVPDAPMKRPPAWMARAAALAVFLERELRGPVLIDVTVSGSELRLADARRVSVPSRRTWMRVGALERPPTLVAESLGSAAGGVSDALSSTLLGGGPRANEISERAGSTYVDAEALRAGLARLTEALLLGEPWLRVARLLGSVGSRKLTSPPEVEGDLVKSWRRYRAWQEKALAVAARDYSRLVTRAWLMRWAALLLSDGSLGEPISRVHASLATRLGSRITTCDAEIRSLEAALDRGAREAQEFAGALVARGAQSFDALFTGDRHVHATLDELTQWVTDDLARPTLEQRWEAAKLEHTPGEAPPRIHEPDATAATGSARAFVPIAPGSARGPAFTPAGHQGKMPPDPVLVLPDGRAEWVRHLLRARGAVLLTGGALSPVAGLARELGIPAVLAVDRRAAPTEAALTVDGDEGTVEG